jgi:hypothetical protein
MPEFGDGTSPRALQLVNEISSYMVTSRRCATLITLRALYPEPRRNSNRHVGNSDVNWFLPPRACTCHSRPNIPVSHADKAVAAGGVCWNLPLSERTEHSPKSLQGAKLGCPGCCGVWGPPASIRWRHIKYNSVDSGAPWCGTSLRRPRLPSRRHRIRKQQQHWPLEPSSAPLLHQSCSPVRSLFRNSINLLHPTPPHNDTACRRDYKIQGSRQTNPLPASTPTISLFFRIPYVPLGLDETCTKPTRHASIEHAAHHGRREEEGQSDVGFSSAPSRARRGAAMAFAHATETIDGLTSAIPATPPARRSRKKTRWPRPSSRRRRSPTSSCRSDGAVAMGGRLGPVDGMLTRGVRLQRHGPPQG